MLYVSLDEYTKEESVKIISSGNKSEIIDVIAANSLYSDDLEFIEELIGRYINSDDEDLVRISIQALADLVRRFKKFDLKKWLKILDFINLKHNPVIIGAIDDLMSEYDNIYRQKITNSEFLKCQKGNKTFYIFENKYKSLDRILTDYGVYSKNKRNKMKFELIQSYDLEEVFSFSKKEFGIKKEDWIKNEKSEENSAN
ncbi:MAG: hypothetical protein IJ566_01385 [Cardiobacteriaceae bacterium]|nr:hypothetical protein [Cardiobacteriaceae bacterium]